MLAIPTSVLTETFGAETVRRGTAYAGEGRVSGLTETESGGAVTVRAAVRGTGRRIYTTQATVGAARRAGLAVDARCTCPVGRSCKHAVAVLLVAGGAAQPASAWERDLDRVLGDLEERGPRRHGYVPLGLEVDHKPLESRWSAASYSLPIRPLKMGSKGGWSKTGVGWHEVQASMRTSREYDPAQVAVLLDLASAFVRGYGQLHPDLLAQGPMLWPLLQRMEDCGLALVPGRGLSGIVVAADPVRVEADLRADDDGGLRVRLGVTYDEQWWPGEAGEVALVGEPAHGLALLRREAVTDGVRGRELALAPLRDPLPASMQRRLTTRESLLVPQPERERFEVDYLPRLRRQLPTASADGSVVMPEIEPPRLVLTLAWSGLSVESSWAWSYRHGSRTRVFALDAADGGDARDIEAEQELLAALELPEAAGGVLHEPDGGLRPHATWTDRALVDFVDQVLPALRTAAAEGGFELIETGQQLDFRAAQDAPEISFTTGQAEDGPADRDWLDLAISISVDGEPVALGSVVTALTVGDELVFTETGRHVAADHPAFAQLAELVAAARQIVDQPDEGLRVGRADLALWAELEALGVVDEQARSWARAARALTAFEGLPDVAPADLRSVPRPYQYDGIRWLAYLWQSGLGGILADDMGLGKTLQTLALIAHAREQGAGAEGAGEEGGRDAGPFLVVAPTSVIGTWISEAATHTPGLVARAVTSSAARREETLAEIHAGADVVVTSYTLFRLEAEAYRELAWGGLVLDEAHTVKNHQGKTYQEVRRLDVPFRLALTGTPFENRLMELWSLLSIVAPGLFPSPKAFNERVVRPIEQQGDADALARFQRRIRPFLLRRTKEIVASDLPPKQEQVLEIALSAKHRRIYDTQLQRERQTVLGLVDDFARNRIAIFGALTRLRQLALDPALVDAKHEGVGSAKLDALVEHLQELAAEGHRALVFSQFTSYLKRVRERLERDGIETVYLDGRTRNRPAVVESFRSGAQPAFLISLKAGGSGLTLTEADYVFVLDPWWNPAVEAQAIDRAHRIGQQRHVMAYRMVSAGTIEEKVMALKESKAALFGRVLDGDGAMAEALNAEDVRALFEA